MSAAVDVGRYVIAWANENGCRDVKCEVLKRSFDLLMRSEKKCVVIHLSVAVESLSGK